MALPSTSKVFETALATDGKSAVAIPWKAPDNIPFVLEAAGKNRNEFSTLGANSDVEAISTWIADTGSHSEHTGESYRREVERFLLWASTIKSKSLSELLRDDLLEFAEFISKLPESWIMSKRHRRNSPNWRPYLNQPSTDTQVRTMGVINNLFNYLVKSGWLKTNPMPIIKRPKSGKTDASPVLRSLSPTDVEYVIRAINTLPEKTERQKTTKARDAWLFYLYWTTAARASETIAPMSNIREVEINGVTGRIWRILGKGGKEGFVPVADKAIVKLMEFRKRLGVTLLPDTSDQIPIVPSVQGLNPDGTLKKTPGPLCRKAIDKRLKALFSVAVNLAESDGQSSTQLRQASTHWLRHTSIREFYDETGDIKLAQQFARHGNINTTSKYAEQSLNKVFEAIQNKG